MQHWLLKFRHALRGLLVGVREETSCRIHAWATVAVVTLAIWLPVSTLEAAILALAVASVWTAELLNSALERLARSLNRNPDPQLRDALDLAAGGVFTMALGAGLVGVLILGKHLGGLFLANAP